MTTKFFVDYQATNSHNGWLTVEVNVRYNPRGVWEVSETDLSIKSISAGRATMQTVTGRGDSLEAALQAFSQNKSEANKKAWECVKSR